MNSQQFELLLHELRRIARALELNTALPDDIIEIEQREPCPECGVYGGGHMQGCKLMPADDA